MTFKNFVLSTAALLTAVPAWSQSRPVSLDDSFQVGANALCSAQLLQARRGDGMFDRTYALVCRDATAPVGELFVLRGDSEAALARIQRDSRCAPGAPVTLPEAGEVRVLNCAATETLPARTAYLLDRDDRVYAAHGVSGYESALGVGLQTILLDRPVDQPVEIAVTRGSGAADFARAQAAQLSPEAALAEAYRRSNAGDFAAAAEFFAAAGRGDGPTPGSAEALLNAALQQSNLGHHARADELFEQAAPMIAADPVLLRMRRNYQAIHQLNQGDGQAALAVLSAPLPAAARLETAELERLTIDRELAERLNAEAEGAGGLAQVGERLLPAERAETLDGQASQLRGAVHRLAGDPAGARAALGEALDRLAAVRGGRIGSVAWMRAQIMGELAAIAEAEGDAAEAERQYRSAVALVESRYPASPALLSTRALLASFLARAGREDEAVALYRMVVELAEQAPSPALKRLIGPYLAILSRRSADPAAIAEMFRAGQVLVRPGVAQTQAVLARELSGGSDEAAALFRRSLNLARDVERTRVVLAELASRESRSSADSLRIAELEQRLASLQTLQVATQAELSRYPRYRAVSDPTIELDALQSELRDGEAYLKLVVLEGASYGLFVSRNSARAFDIGLDEAALDGLVTAIRESINRIENGQNVTYPFDVARAQELYGRLLGPVDGELASVRHLIFEPDGAMLTLPLNLLVTDRASVAAYEARANAENGDPFDFTGIGWLGRRVDVTTAVSASGFRDIRNARPSAARRAYLGFGQNQPVDMILASSGTRSSIAFGSTCQWPLATWARPISADELVTAQSAISRYGGAGGEVITGPAFTDSQIRRMDSIDDYRVVHFATHGLVTAPRPECPALPALLTSFGETDSDGLLTFAEIFDLRIDADLVILSACDTAGGATEATTRAAGVTSGGGTAMDGLVRAFVGAGGRSVLASHWPVPDDFSATQRLISGLFTAPAGTSTARALQASQLALMDDPRTSHPYYWSAFAIVGDGSIPVIGAASAETAAPAPPEAAARLR
nr:CHAT domain-containing protein [Sphingosinicella terrae]